MTKVLIVDDEPLVLRSTEALLGDLGFETASVSAAEDVLEAVRRERPDVVLQDLRMPGLDVDALLTSLHDDPDLGRTPIILFSASIDLATTQARVQAAGVLEKPFKPKDAVEAIRHAMGAA